MAIKLSSVLLKNDPGIYYEVGGINLENGLVISQINYSPTDVGVQLEVCYSSERSNSNIVEIQRVNHRGDYTLVFFPEKRVK